MKCGLGYGTTVPCVTLILVDTCLNDNTYEHLNGHRPQRLLYQEEMSLCFAYCSCCCLYWPETSLEIEINKWASEGQCEGYFH